MAIEHNSNFPKFKKAADGAAHLLAGAAGLSIAPAVAAVYALPRAANAVTPNFVRNAADRAIGSKNWRIKTINERLDNANEDYYPGIGFRELSANPYWHTFAGTAVKSAAAASALVEYPVAGTASLTYNTLGLGGYAINAAADATGAKSFVAYPFVAGYERWKDEIKDTQNVEQAEKIQKALFDLIEDPDGNKFSLPGTRSFDEKSSRNQRISLEDVINKIEGLDIPEFRFRGQLLPDIKPLLKKAVEETLAKRADENDKVSLWDARMVLLSAVNNIADNRSGRNNPIKKGSRDALAEIVGVNVADADLTPMHDFARKRNKLSTTQPAAADGIIDQAAEAIEAADRALLNPLSKETVKEHLNSSEAADIKAGRREAKAAKDAAGTEEGLTKLLGVGGKNVAAGGKLADVDYDNLAELVKECQKDPMAFAKKYGIDIGNATNLLNEFTSLVDKDMKLSKEIGGLYRNAGMDILKAPVKGTGAYVLGSLGVLSLGCPPVAALFFVAAIGAGASGLGSMFSARENVNNAALKRRLEGARIELAKMNAINKALGGVANKAAANGKEAMDGYSKNVEESQKLGGGVTPPIATTVDAAKLKALGVDVSGIPTAKAVNAHKLAGTPEGKKFVGDVNVAVNGDAGKLEDGLRAALTEFNPDGKDADKTDFSGLVLKEAGLDAAQIEALNKPKVAVANTKEAEDKLAAAEKEKADVEGKLKAANEEVERLKKAATSGSEEEKKKAQEALDKAVAEQKLLQDAANKAAEERIKAVEALHTAQVFEVANLKGQLDKLERELKAAKDGVAKGAPVDDEALKAAKLAEQKAQEVAKAAEEKVAKLQKQLDEAAKKGSTLSNTEKEALEKQLKDAQEKAAKAQKDLTEKSEATIEAQKARILELEEQLAAAKKGKASTSEFESQSAAINAQIAQLQKLFSANSEKLSEYKDGAFAGKDGERDYNDALTASKKQFDKAMQALEKAKEAAQQVELAETTFAAAQGLTGAKLHRAKTPVLEAQEGAESAVEAANAALKELGSSIDKLSQVERGLLLASLDENAKGEESLGGEGSLGDEERKRSGSVVITDNSVVSVEVKLGNHQLSVPTDVSSDLNTALIKELARDVKSGEVDLDQFVTFRPFLKDKSVLQEAGSDLVDIASLLDDSKLATAENAGQIKADFTKAAEAFKAHALIDLATVKNIEGNKQQVREKALQLAIADAGTEGDEKKIAGLQEKVQNIAVLSDTATNEYGWIVDGVAKKAEEERRSAELGGNAQSLLSAIEQKVFDKADGLIAGNQVLQDRLFALRLDSQLPSESAAFIHAFKAVEKAADVDRAITTLEKQRVEAEKAAASGLGKGGEKSISASESPSTAGTGNIASENKKFAESLTYELGRGYSRFTNGKCVELYDVMHQAGFITTGNALNFRQDTYNFYDNKVNELFAEAFAGADKNTDRTTLLGMLGNFIYKVVNSPDVSTAIKQVFEKIFNAPKDQSLKINGHEFKVSEVINALADGFNKAFKDVKKEGQDGALLGQAYQNIKGAKTINEAQEAISHALENITKANHLSSAGLFQAAEALKASMKIGVDAKGRSNSLGSELSVDLDGSENREHTEEEKEIIAEALAKMQKISSLADNMQKTYDEAIDASRQQIKGKLGEEAAKSGGASVSEKDLDLATNSHISALKASVGDISKEIKRLANREELLIEIVGGAALENDKKDGAEGLISGTYHTVGVMMLGNMPAESDHSPEGNAMRVMINEAIASDEGLKGAVDKLKEGSNLRDAFISQVEEILVESPNKDLIVEDLRKNFSLDIADSTALSKLGRTLGELYSKSNESVQKDLDDVVNSLSILGAGIQRGYEEKIPARQIARKGLWLNDAHIGAAAKGMGFQVVKMANAGEIEKVEINFEETPEGQTKPVIITANTQRQGDNTLQSIISEAIRNAEKQGTKGEIVVGAIMNRNGGHWTGAEVKINLDTKEVSIHEMNSTTGAAKSPIVLDGYAITHDAVALENQKDGSTCALQAYSNVVDKMHGHSDKEIAARKPSEVEIRGAFSQIAQQKNPEQGMVIYQGFRGYTNEQKKQNVIDGSEVKSPTVEQSAIGQEVKQSTTGKDPVKGADSGTAELTDAQRKLKNLLLDRVASDAKFKGKQFDDNVIKAAENFVKGITEFSSSEIGKALAGYVNNAKEGDILSVAIVGIMNLDDGTPAFKEFLREVKNDKGGAATKENLRDAYWNALSVKEQIKWTVGISSKHHLGSEHVKYLAEKIGFTFGSGDIDMVAAGKPLVTIVQNKEEAEARVDMHGSKSSADQNFIVLYPTGKDGEYAGFAVVHFKDMPSVRAAIKPSSSVEAFVAGVNYLHNQSPENVKYVEGKSPAEGFDGYNRQLVRNTLATIEKPQDFYNKFVNYSATDLAKAGVGVRYGEAESLAKAASSKQEEESKVPTEGPKNTAGFEQSLKAAVAKRANVSQAVSGQGDKTEDDPVQPLAPQTLSLDEGKEGAAAVPQKTGGQQGLSMVDELKITQERLNKGESIGVSSSKHKTQTPIEVPEEKEPEFMQVELKHTATAGGNQDAIPNESELELALKKRKSNANFKKTNEVNEETVNEGKWLGEATKKILKPESMVTTLSRSLVDKFKNQDEKNAFYNEALAAARADTTFINESGVDRISAANRIVESIITFLKGDGFAIPTPDPKNNKNTYNKLTSNREGVAETLFKLLAEDKDTKFFGDNIVDIVIESLGITAEEFNKALLNPKPEQGIKQIRDAIKAAQEEEAAKAVASKGKDTIEGFLKEVFNKLKEANSEESVEKALNYNKVYEYANKKGFSLPFNPNDKCEDAKGGLAALICSLAEHATENKEAYQKLAQDPEIIDAKNTYLAQQEEVQQPVLQSSRGSDLSSTHSFGGDDLHQDIAFNQAILEGMIEMDADRVIEVFNGINKDTYLSELTDKIVGLFADKVSDGKEFEQSIKEYIEGEGFKEGSKITTDQAKQIFASIIDRFAQSDDNGLIPPSCLMALHKSADLRNAIEANTLGLHSRQERGGSFEGSGSDNDSTASHTARVSPQRQPQDGERRESTGSLQPQDELQNHDPNATHALDGKGGSDLRSPFVTTPQSSKSSVHQQAREAATSARKSMTAIPQGASVQDSTRRASVANKGEMGKS